MGAGGDDLEGYGRDSGMEEEAESERSCEGGREGGWKGGPRRYIVDRTLQNIKLNRHLVPTGCFCCCSFC